MRRYTKFHGKKLVHPFVDRDVPIILDAELVKMDFGTGAVKVTPAHDPNDNAAGKRHGLEFVSIITKDGRMADNCGQFSGLMRFDARMAIVEKLKDLGKFLFSLLGLTADKKRVVSRRRAQHNATGNMLAQQRCDRAFSLSSVVARLQGDGGQCCGGGAQ